MNNLDFCPACEYSGIDEQMYMNYGCPDCSCTKTDADKTVKNWAEFLDILFGGKND